jgi:hypothetical protein
MLHYYVELAANLTEQNEKLGSKMEGTRKEVRVRDPFDMFETHQLPCDPVSSLSEQVETVNVMLEGVEKDLSDFWEANSMPRKPVRLRRVNDGPWFEGPPEPVSPPAKLEARWWHPSEEAVEGSWPWLAWQQWQRLINLRQAIARGALHEAAAYAFALGRKQAEIAAARRHGHQSKAARNSEQGRVETHTNKRETKTDYWADRLPILDRIDAAIPRSVSRDERRREVATRYKIEAEEPLKYPSAAEKRLQKYRRALRR